MGTHNVGKTFFIPYFRNYELILYLIILRVYIYMHTHKPNIWIFMLCKCGKNLFLEANLLFL